MKIERVDDKTVKCYISNEELEQYNIDYKDFVTRTEKAREVVQDIILQASQEVGFKPPQFAFDLQIMMIPDQGLILTFSEKDPADLKEGAQFLEFLKEMKKMFQQAKEQAGIVPEPTDKASGEAPQQVQKPAPPDFAVFVFRNLGRVMEFAAVLPKNLRVKSELYVMNGLYYVHLQKGAASYERYSRACVQALEFAGLFAADKDRLEYLREHGECLIEEQALKKLRLN